MSRKKKKAKAASAENYTALAEHQREGKLLKPPFAKLTNFAFSSWFSDRLPELLWAALLITHVGRNEALQIFRRVAKAAEGSFQTGSNPNATHSGLASLPGDLAHKIVGTVCSSAEARSVLRSLLLLDDLPSKDLWNSAIGERPTSDDWHSLAVAVGHTFDHQSQEATDCRWCCVLFKVICGQVTLPSREMVEEILFYPDKGDQRKVRPMIRATEIAFATGPGTETSAWSAAFWEECRRKTSCVPRPLVPASISIRVGTTATRVAAVSAALANHSAKTRVTTGIDPRHDAVFGFAGYALAILGELMRVGNSSAILGRLGLRTLLESFVNLQYLAARDDPKLWLAFRQYGAGQAKLAFLKLDETELGEVGHVSRDLLDAVANEDQSLEYLTINVGHWDDSNLRLLADKAGVKDTYDAVFPWSSAFVHANWGAFRSCCFDLCINPLHRAHRILRTDALALNDVLDDAARLVDGILDVVARLYGPFPERVSVSPAGA
ncbi:MAG TPA: DUF5677 domain-containing protein [Gemmatimonadales bacterium]|nr:DUF5677 domain-containing protein [Gemmatimonadales bacterium]